MATTPKHELSQEDVANSFKTVAAKLGSNIKPFLLRRIGIASHEISINLSGDRPFAQETRISIHNSYDYHSFFQRSVCFSNFCIINSSGTSPAITEIRILAIIPDDNPLQFIVSRGDNNEYDHKAGWEKQFTITSELKKAEVLDLPLLSPGKYLAIPGKDFSIYVCYPEATEKLLEIMDSDPGNEDKPREFFISMRERAESYFGTFMENVQVWLGVVLDSKELLPFEWDSDSQEFVRGFKTVGLQIRP